MKETGMNNWGSFSFWRISKVYRSPREDKKLLHGRIDHRILDDVIRRSHINDVLVIQRGEQIFMILLYPIESKGNTRWLKEWVFDWQFVHKNKVLCLYFISMLCWRASWSWLSSREEGFVSWLSDSSMRVVISSSSSSWGETLLMMSSGDKLMDFWMWFWKYSNSADMAVSSCWL